MEIQYYNSIPGTNERVCSLSSGEASNIKKGLQMICEKLFEKLTSVSDKVRRSTLTRFVTRGNSDVFFSSR